MAYRLTSKPESKCVSDDKTEEGSMLRVNIGTADDIQVGARKAYDRLRSIGLTEEVTFEGFLAIYSLGTEGSDVDTGKNPEDEGLNLKTIHGQGRGRGDGYNLGSVGAIRRKNSKLGKSNQRRIIPPGKETVSLEDLQDWIKKKGKWQEALDVLSERLVGRKEVARVRANIAAEMVASGGRSDVTEAENEQERLYRVLASVKKEWQVEHERLAGLHSGERKLAMAVEHQKRVLLFLNVLDKMETVRMKRIVGISDMVKTLRVQATSASQNFQDVLNRIRILQPSRPLSMHVASRLRALERSPDKHTKHALANLHAYHTRLSRLKRKSISSGAHNTDNRLEDALKALGVSDIHETKRKLVAVAKLRAERKRKLNQVLMKPPLDKRALDEMQAKNEQKKMQFQNTLKTAVALGWVCEGYIDMISTFCSETAASLENAMEEERKHVEGHVDKIKAEIIKAPESSGSTFGQDVRKIMNTTRVKVWEEVEDLVKRPWLNADQLPDRPSEIKEESVKMDVSRVSELLDRKLQKAKHGYTLAQETRSILDGYKKLKYL